MVPDHLSPRTGAAGRTAAELGPGDLIAAHYALARCDRHGVARLPFAERVAAAAAGGFGGIGIQPDDYERSRAAGLDDATMGEVLERHQILLAEIDGVTWWPEPGRPEIVDAQDRALRLAATFAARHLIAPMPATEPPHPSPEALAERFAALCDRAADHGLLVGLEFLPWTSVTELRGATKIVELASRPNGGLTFDFWHHCAGGGDEATLRSIGTAPIVAVHLTDGHRDPALDPFTETMVGRRFPGEGELPVTSLLETLADLGVRVPLTVEIVSLDHRHLPPDELAQALSASVRRALQSARWPGTAA